jgi:uncharacterized membrane protein YczE
MENRIIRFSVRNIISYFVGFFILGFGVVILLRSQLGAGAWDTVTYNLRAFIALTFPGVTLGMVSFLVSGVIFSVILVYRKRIKYLFMLLPIGLVGLSIDFWDILIFDTYYPNDVALKALFYLIGTITLPLGLSLIVLSDFPAFVFDELTILLMKVFKTNKLGTVRLGIELGGIAIGILFGVLAGIGLGAVNFGSIVLAIILGPIMAFYIKTISKWYGKTNA